MKKAIAISFVLVFLAMGWTAHAQVGPLNGVTGFPTWVRDINGVQVQLCDVVGGIEAPPCPGLALIDPLLGVVDGNIEEAIYYGAEAAIDLADGTSILGIFFVEAVGAAAPDPALISNGIRIRIRLPQAAVGNRVFTVSSPWNAATAVTVLDGDTTADVILPTAVDAPAPDFVGAVAGPVNVFIGNNTGGCVGIGFLGDGVTPAALSAVGPTGTDIFTVQEAAIGTVTTNLFAVEGKLFAPAAQAAGGFAVERATVSGAGARSIGTLIASTNLGDGMQITGVAGTVLTTPIVMVPDGTGRFFANFPAGNVSASPFPIAIDVSVTSGGVAVPTLVGTQALMTDLVSVRSASYSIRARTLTVNAASSAPAPRTAPVTLTVTGTDANGNPVGSINTPIVGRGLRLPNILVPPSYVTVTSSRGGSLTVPVTIR